MKIQGMVREIEQYRNGKPEVIADGSKAQIVYALQDSRHDILVLWDRVFSMGVEIEKLKSGND